MHHHSWVHSWCSSKQQASMICCLFFFFLLALSQLACSMLHAQRVSFPSRIRYQVANLQAGWRWKKWINTSFLDFVRLYTAFLNRRTMDGHLVLVFVFFVFFVFLVFLVFFVFFVFFRSRFERYPCNYYLTVWFAEFVVITTYVRARGIYITVRGS